jgi:hypothetical protein
MRSSSRARVWAGLVKMSVSETYPAVALIPVGASTEC